ncbi:MAG: right-handed parallel beta-helix repeat-containing protein, partial [Paludibacter sp.]|nr:right-handed parallel beta-helix repeat-containing protein [Paludibacter sp.]
MKKFYVLIGMLSLIFLSNSQTRISFTETFDGASQSFTTTPTSAWMVDSSLSASGKQSCWGFVPNNTGDSIMLVSPLYDLTPYAYAYLRFTHICKVAKEDIVTIEYREDYVGAKWTRIPNSRYEGNSLTYRKQRTFNDESYVEWVGNDLLAEPDNSWWKNEGFDISQDVSYARVQFRFKIVKGTSLGSQFAWGWLIDNFELFASVNEIKPPVVELMEPYVNGTVFGTGPFQITAKAAKRTLLALEKPILRMTFRDMNGIVTHDSTYMTAIEGDSIWIGTIPQKSIGTRVDYSVYAYDTAGNYGTVYSSYLIGRKWGFDSNSVAINAIDTPKRGAIAGITSPVVVSIENRGLQTLSSADIQWTLNGVLQSSVHWTGSLIEGFSTNVTIGNYIPRLAQYDTITVWVTNPNGMPNTSEDSLMSKIAYGCTQILGGDYTVGPTGQFPTINDALEILNLCGTSGNVNLKLENGTYVQGIQLFDLNEITGAYDVLTITSLSGNPADVILKNDSTQTMVIDLARSHNVVIKDLTIDAREGTVGVRVTDTCYNIEVSNCTILLDTVSAVATAGIYKDGNGSLMDKFRILNNTINGGYYGIYIYGADQSNYNTNLSIVGNTLKNTYYAGIYMRYNQFTNITANIMTTRPANMGNTYYGMYAYYNHGRYITKNKIRTSKAVSDPIGMYIYYMNYQDSTNMALIANNEIIIHVSSSAQDGMTIAYTSANIMHNSILRTGPSAGAALWLVSSASILNVKNNNLVTEGGYPIYLAGTSYLGTTWLLDYNNYYSSTASFVGYAGGAIADMTTWRTTTGQDSNSVNIFPTFADTSKNLRLAHYTGLECPVEAWVSTDIIDSARVGITAMGAYTPIPLDFDATVLGANNWSTSAIVNQSTAVDAIIMNASLVDTLTSLTVNWSIDGVVQTPKNWFGQLIPYATDIVNLGNFIPVGEYNHITIWLTNPNGQSADMNPLNDTLNLSTYGCLAPLSGTYTIGGQNADFASISEANTIIGFCGINGPVVFELAPGLYSNVSFTGTYLGADSINTVTFTSASGKADSVIFNGMPNGISISNVHHLTITHVTVDAFGADYGILIGDSCSNLEISHCNIICDPAITSTQAGIRYYNNTTLSDNIRLIGNTINGGYYGIYFYGVSQTSHPSRIRIDSNVLTNQYYYATYCYYSDFTSISHN